MIAIVQRVTEARVLVNGDTVGEIGHGMLALVAAVQEDAQSDVTWMANKLASLRIFRNPDKHFDRDIREVLGAILLVSNFTVAAQTKRGRRPSFDQAAPGDSGRSLLDQLQRALLDLGVPVATGVFGADMQVQIVNDGPATFIVNSRGE